MSNSSIRQREVAAASRKQIDEQRKDELQRVDIEDHDEQQHAIEQHREVVLQAITTKEFVLVVPDNEKQREANRKGAEAAHRLH